MKPTQRYFVLLLAVGTLLSPRVSACCNYPFCDFSVNPVFVGLGDRVSFNACYPKSFDPDGGTIDYLWSFGSGAAAITGANGCSPSCKYTTPGGKSVTLRVRDHDSTDCIPCLFDCVDHMSDPVERAVIVSSVVKITRNNSSDEGPFYTCVGASASLFADTGGYPYPPNNPVWSIVSQPAGASATLTPPQGSAVTTVDNLIVPGVYTVKAKCGAEDPGDTFTIIAIGVGSLIPDQGVEFDDGDNDPDTRSFALCVAPSGVVTVTATPIPAVAESLLPPSWALVGGTGTGKLVRTVNKTITDLTTITCICGNTIKKVKMYVINLQMSYQGGGPLNRNFTFDGGHPGICYVPVTGTTGTVLDNGLVWNLSEISGSVLTSWPANRTGTFVDFFYTDLPESNSAFGPKTITMTHPLLPAGMNSLSQTVEIYYSFAAKNWPGAGPDGGLYPLPPGYNLPYANPPYRFEKTNWFFYYSQTGADFGCTYNRMSGGSITSTQPPHTPLVGNLEIPRYNHNEGVLGGRTLWGIDCFAWASRHEMKHSIDFGSWWPGGLVPTEDTDSDSIRDGMESGIPASSGGPFNPTQMCTNNHEFHWPEPVGGSSAAIDCEWECVHSQASFAQGDWYDEDWAFPGSRWH
jgi:hypothetical protein